VTPAEFFYDLGSPYAWLAAERVDGLFDEPPVWTPVLLGGIFKATGRSSWGTTGQRADRMAEIELRAVSRGLPPVHWPDPWPNDGLHVMRVAAHADSRAFALAAFRAHFNGGRALSDPATVAAIAQQVGVDPVEDKQRLRDNTDRALALGVSGVPSVVAAGRVHWGDDRLADAVASARGEQLE
jgi:2-hydroxychromene-2-carboxylate isomerase